MSFTLGAAPEGLTVQLARGGDFFTTLQNADDPWPVGVSIELRFGRDALNPDDTWTATIDDDLATFSVDKAVVDALIAAKPSLVRLYYVDGTTDLCWATGRVSTS